MLSFAEASNVQVFNIKPDNGDHLSLTLDVGQRVSGSFSVNSDTFDQQIDFWVTDPDGVHVVDYGLVSSGAVFDFTANEEGTYTLEFFDFSFLSYSYKTVILTYDVTTPEVAGPDYLFYSVVIALTLALVLTFIFIAYDRARSRRSVKEIKRRPMVRVTFWSNSSVDTCFLL